MTAAAIENAKQLNLIVRAGAEFDTIDVRAASKRGIYVANCPGKNASAVAELVFGLMVALDRRIPDAVASLRAGKWERQEYGKAEGLHGKTLGIAGMGAIGREVAQRREGLRAERGRLEPVAHAGAGGRARASSYAASHRRARRARATSSSLHLALTERTRQIVNRRVLELLPERAMLINTARADLVDYDGAAARPSRSAACAWRLDVYPDEPRGLEDVRRAGALPAASARAGSSTGRRTSRRRPTRRSSRSRPRRCASSARSCSRATVPNVVNVSSSSAARFQLVIRMMDKVGTFANVLAVLKRHGINVEEVTNTVFEGGVAACAKLRLLLAADRGVPRARSARSTRCCTSTS